MVIKVSKDQYDELEAENIKYQLNKTIIGYIDSIEDIDDVLVNKVKLTDENTCQKHMKNIFNLTSVEQYQRSLFMLIIDTGIDLFENEEFSYILNHPFLCGDAKARHIILSSMYILGVD